MFLAPLLVVTAFVAPAAASGCTAVFDSGPARLTITCTGAGSGGTLSRTADGSILLDGAATGAGVANTDTIQVNGSTGHTHSFTIDETNGLFAPGKSAEADDPEIEITVTFDPAVVNTVTLVGQAVDDHITIVTSGGPGFRVNSDTDLDIGLPTVTGLSIVAGDGNDIVIGTVAPTDVFLSVSGGNGNDALFGSAATDLIVGNDGDDTLHGSPGADTLDGGAGNDTLSYLLSSDPVAVGLPSTANGGDAQGDSISGFENLVGSENDDVLFGDANDNRLIGRGGADSMAGGDGVDTIEYSTSSSPVTIDLATHSASGGDAAGDAFSTVENVLGSSGADHITGDAASNVIDGRGGADVLSGGDGVDTLSYASSPFGIVVDLGAGAGTGGDAAGDSVSGFENVTGSTHGDDITGDAGPNVIRGGSDIVGSDSLDGGRGRDTLDYSTSPAAVSVDLKAGTASGGDATGDTFSSFENVTGSAFRDDITGSDRGNVLRGLAGGDRLDGLLGTDTLNGGAGHDTCVNGETLVSCEASVRRV